MVSSSSFCRLILLLNVILSIRLCSSEYLCPLDSEVFRNCLQSRCPLGISPNPPIEMNGEFLDRALTSKQKNAYTSVLFYASWCPFSRSVRPKFETLSSMFPQMEHYVVEQSAALPSIFSRYGIHRLPSILLVNQTSRLQYHGPKDLHSLVKFYERTTGLQSLVDEPFSLGDNDGLVVHSWNVSSMREMIEREPYLLFAVLVLCLRGLIYVFPEVLSRLKAVWVLYIPHLNLEIFGETSQLFGRALHLIDVRRVLTKLRLCKTRNFCEGAKNARVWASSLASVSLGKSSSSRSSSSSS